MADYIERQAALQAVNEFFHDPKVDVALNTAPAANVREDVHGEWLHDHTDMVGGNFAVVRCSVCGYKAYAIADHIRNGNFCPNCGARMAGGGER